MQLMRRTLATLALLAAASRAQDTLEASGGDQELGSGGGEVTIEAGSGGSGEAEAVLEHSVSYTMASSDGSFTIRCVDTEEVRCGEVTCPVQRHAGGAQ